MTNPFKSYLKAGNQNVRMLTVWVFLLLTIFGGCSKPAEEKKPVETVLTAAEEKKPPVIKPAPKIAGEACLESVCFKEALYLDEQEYYLAGMGKRQYLWADIYTAAFYLPKGKPEFNHGVPQGPKVIVLEYQRTIEKQKIIDSIINNVVENPDADHVHLRPRFDDFTEGFEPPHKGSRYFFVYEPEKGTALIKDGITTVTIPGNDFADAFYGIWLHEGTGNQDLRKSLLGRQIPS